MICPCTLQLLIQSGISTDVEQVCVGLTAEDSEMQGISEKQNNVLKIITG